MVGRAATGAVNADLHQGLDLVISASWTVIIGFLLMLPLGLLNAAQGHPMLVELKNGETLNGHLVSCDTWMNLTLKEVVQTSPEGDKFFRLPEVYVRGNNIKYLRVPDDIVDLVKDQQQNQPSSRGRGGPVGRGEHGGRDRGRGPNILQGSSGSERRQHVHCRSRNTRTQHWPLQSINPHQTRRELRDDFFQSRSSVSYETRGRGLQETYDDLWAMCRKADYLKVQALVEHLIKVRGEKPNRRIYDALILANAHAEYGSPAEVTKLLQEMDDEGITADSATYHAVIRVLAIHPDHLLRTDILSCLRQRWYSLTKEGYHDLVTGLIRERQLELALQYLETMQVNQIRVSPWLFDMLIYTLCDVGEFDEAVRLVHQRLDLGELMISGGLWYHLLDTASRAIHHQGTLFVYNARVVTSYLNPPSGVCTNILICAARHGDAKLATAVLRKLSERSGSSLQLQHYESLIEAYITAGDLFSALDLLTTMLTAGQAPTESSTRPIFIYLKRSRHHPMMAVHVLEELRDQARPIPIAALNTVLQAYIQQGNLPAALHVYNSISLYTASPPTERPQKPLVPNTTTFNGLLRGCAQAKDKAKAMFLASEMVALQVRPNALTYDRLVLVCLTGDQDLTDAWRYVEEMRGWGFAMRGGTAVALARKACEHKDERVWGLSKAKGGMLETWKVDQLMSEYWGKTPDAAGERARTVEA
ncbi:MAG: hypothetical protein Q9163_001228 [Psora crenata]